MARPLTIPAFLPCKLTEKARLSILDVGRNTMRLELVRDLCSSEVDEICVVCNLVEASEDCERSKLYLMAADEREADPLPPLIADDYEGEHDHPPRDTGMEVDMNAAPLQPPGAAPAQPDPQP